MRCIVLVCWFLTSGWLFGQTPNSADAHPAQKAIAERYTQAVLPVLKRLCLDCHDAEQQKGELDLARFAGMAQLRAEPEIWQQVRYQLQTKEMPPAKKSQPNAAERTALLDWVDDFLHAEALANAGDPGPVVLRRLSNAEYRYTLRDLTGVDSLDPAREFPVDGAAGEGFSNTGAALVMSPGLLDKYLAAAKDVAQHAALVEDGIVWSSAISRRDWTEERLTAIRTLYQRYSVPGGNEAHNLQGVRFTTSSAGVIPLTAYLRATIEQRSALAAGEFEPVASKAKLSSTYLRQLWAALNAKTPSGQAAKADTQPVPLLDPIRVRWRAANPGDADAAAKNLAKEIAVWQAALATFGKVGHIGKRDGPTAWQMPVTPLETSQDIRLEFPKDQQAATLHLVLDDAGDGNNGDRVQWKNARLIVPNRPAVPLAQLGTQMKQAETNRDAFVAKLPDYLAGLAASHRAEQSLEAGAKKAGLDISLAQKLAAFLQLGRVDVPQPTGHYVLRNEQGGGKPSLNGWHADGGLPSIVANSSTKTVSTSTPDFPGRSISMHPLPEVDAVLFWRAPVDTTIVVTGRVADADDACGNGAAWRVELLSSSGSALLAEGVYDRGKHVSFGLTPSSPVRKGDLIKFRLNARDKSHVCDNTRIDLTIREVAGDQRQWDLAGDVVDRILDANPLPDRLGNPDVWHFCQAPASGVKPRSEVPLGSALAAWRDAVNGDRSEAELGKLARAVKDRLQSKEPAAADAQVNERFLNWHWQQTAGAASGAVIEQTASSVLRFEVPANLAAGARFEARVELDPEAAGEASVRASARLGAAREPLGGPVLVRADSPAQARWQREFDAFRALFPAALCYSKIVPTDEVVTLRLFHREDQALSRLMLNETEAAELDRLWRELHFVSLDKLKLVDVFDQLWQYSTQDSDPSALDPLRKPIRDDAAGFREAMKAAEPRQLEAVVAFANEAWRRPLRPEESEALQALYQQLRSEQLDHESAIRLLIARVLTAPAFLYKIEKPGITTGPVDDFELATRLSYFLWSSAPDAELRRLAEAGRLHEPKTLAAQTRRMLQAPQVARLGLEFGCQWLGVRDVDTLDEKSERHFPEFVELRESMRDEPARFITQILREDGSVLSLLDADHSYLDAKLAAFYGLPAPAADGRVTGLRERGRGGVLGMAATLAKQSGASRSSPILRGNWIYETLLGQHLPKPPADVPQLPEVVPGDRTERQLIEQHSNDPACAKCHNKIDPYGFALEGFDAIGRAREGRRTDAELPDGSRIDGLAGLRGYLLKQGRDPFVRQFCRKLLGYALGRSVRLSDQPLLDEMVRTLGENDFRVGVAVEMIVQSPQFQQIRGTR